MRNGDEGVLIHNDDDDDNNNNKVFDYTRSGRRIRTPTWYKYYLFAVFK